MMAEILARVTERRREDTLQIVMKERKREDMPLRAAIKKNLNMR